MGVKMGLSRRLSRLVYLCLLSVGAMVVLLMWRVHSQGQAPGTESVLVSEMRNWAAKRAEMSVLGHHGAEGASPGSSVVDSHTEGVDATGVITKKEGNGPGDLAVVDSPGSLGVKEADTPGPVNFSSSGYRITTGVSGRMGNQMFQYASILGIAAMNGMQPFYPSNDLARVFKLNHGGHVTNRGFQVVFEKHFMTYDPSFEHLPPGDTTIMQYFQSWKYFRHVSDLVRKEFAFQPYYANPARDMISKYSASGTGNRTLVGVHVRRGDMFLPKHVKMGYYSAPLSYLRKAMDYMRGRHGSSVLFLIMTDDAPWCQQNLKAPDVAVVDKAPAEVHLAVLASCQHVIMTSGTFGWWGGYLAGGEVVYYWDRNKLLHQPPLPVDILHPEDFFPPHWLPLD